MDPAAFTDAEFRAAIARVNRAMVTGQIRSVTNDYVPLVIKGKLAAWPSDITLEQPQYPVMRKIGPALVTDPYVFPSPEMLARGHYFRLLPPARSIEYRNAFASAVGL